MPDGKVYTNSLGMQFVRIEPGTFQMGQSRRLQPEVLPIIRGGERGGRFDLLADGDYDEKPVHKVDITKPFHMATQEVTNKVFELFDPGHRRLRGKEGLSVDDDEAVIFVSWYEAQAFCDWLSDKDGLPYRLPTEAEWEYSCRASTTTHFHTGDLLPQEFHRKRVGKDKPRAPLHVGQTPPNAWGLQDMHGNVEEWCEDWYGPYESAAQNDPVGRAAGDFRVTRGGSHSTDLYYLRSGNRLGALPEERNWLIGFRVVVGELPGTPPLPAPHPQPHAKNVAPAEPAELRKGPDPSVPYFKGPRQYVHIPAGSMGPIFSRHNHVPNIAPLNNGDLFTIWYTWSPRRAAS